MYQASPMDLAECYCQADSDAQDAGQIERSSLVLLSIVGGNCPDRYSLNSEALLLQS
jgi:hypothetical protein